MEIVVAESPSAILEKPKVIAATKVEDDNKEKEKEKEKEKRRTAHACLAATSEFFFVIVPFIVIAMVLEHKGDLRTIFYLPEWSIVSSVLLGQALIKLVAMTVGASIYKPPIIFVLTLLLVLGLIPALMLLSFVLLADKISTGLAATQCIMFVLGITVYWTVCFGQTYTEFE